MNKKEFINELGNAISIEIQKRDIQNVKGVYITIAGPDSQMEIHVTLEEAKTLTTELGNFLKSK